MKEFDVRNEFQGGYTKRRPETKYLVVHHAAALYPQTTGLADVRAIAKYHVQGNGWPGIGYLEVVAEETEGGELAAYEVSDPDLERAHVFDHNDDAWGMCLATNFDNKAKFPDGVPTDKWFNAAVERLVKAKLLYPTAEIVGHKDIAVKGWTTACPGSAWFRWKQRLIDAVEVKLNEGGLKIFAPARMTEQEFNATLERANSPAAGAPLYAICVKYGVDPAVALAFFATESTYGLEGVVAKYNTRNWGNVREPHRKALALGTVTTPKGVFATYRTWQDSLEDWCLRLKEKYWGQWKLNTVERVVPVYAPSKDNNLPDLYVEGVKALVDRYSASQGYSVLGVDPAFAKAHESSGGVWKARGVLTPGLPLGAAFLVNGLLHQRFERGVVRRNADNTLDWLLLTEIANL